MQLPSSHLSSLHRPFLGFRPQSPKFSLPSSSSSSQIPTSNNPRISCNFSRDRSSSSRDAATTTIKSNKKDNIWTIDNELAAKELGSNNKRTKKNNKGSAVRMRKKRGKGVSGKKGRNGLVLISAAMLMEIETVLQTQEPVIKPSWSTFASSVSGIWKGVGAVFSPFTAEMEPIGMGNQNENLYDCYTLSRIERSPSESLCSQIQRKTNWVALNPSGESRQHMQGSSKNYNGESPDSKKGKYNAVNPNIDLPAIGSFDFGKNELLEEDSMSMEPGLVFFEDGSYSRGPVDIPVGEFDESKYFLSPTFKFEQCLVKGCHKRLRIVHTIEFGEGGSDIQIVRVAVYEEQWISPVNLYDENDEQVLDLIPLSQRQRTQPSELAGSWKVFEVSATPIYGEEDSTMDSDKEQGGGPPYVYLCTETVKKRSLPESAAYFGEEEMLDMNDVTVLWLPGGVTGYVDVSNDGTLCIGVGWYSHEGINLVMERDYGMDGKLKEVRWKSEVKRRWSPDHSGSA